MSADNAATSLDLRMRCRGVAVPSGLRVGVGAALADYGLVRRLPAFAATTAGMEVELTIVESKIEPRAPDIDAPSWDMPSSKAHVVRWPAALMGDERVRQFVKWAVAEAERTTGRRTAAQPSPKVRL